MSFFQRAFVFAKNNQRDLFFGGVALVAVGAVARQELIRHGVLQVPEVHHQPQSNFQMKSKRQSS